MLKRAVITGMGVVSPNGIGKAAFCRAILDGKSGVKLITRFDTSDLPVKIAKRASSTSRWRGAVGERFTGRSISARRAAESSACNP